MSELTVIENVDNFIATQEDDFKSLNKNALNALSFENEANFARQHLCKNDYVLQVARENRQSLVDAICNTASIGLSLNPAYSHAYLVPRKINNVQSICLDISYRGLIKLATDTGVIEYMKAELVYSNDDFEYLGFNKEPTLKTNPFKERGDVVGVYGMAKLASGDFLVETMNIDEILQIRNDSEAFKGALRKGEESYQYTNCVWVKYFGEMTKKTVIKRLYKTLPQTNGMNHLGNAIEVINEHEGINFQEKELSIDYTDTESQEYKRCIEQSDYTGLLCLRESMDYEAQNQLYDLHEAPRIEKGKKGSYTKMMEDNAKVARELRDDNLNFITEYCDQSDDAGIAEILSECSQYEIDWYLRKLNNEQEQFIRGLLQDQAA